MDLHRGSKHPPGRRPSFGNSSEEVAYTMAQAEDEGQSCCAGPKCFLCASVSDALEYCDTELALPQFSESAATVKFLHIFDELFDVLNSQNPFGAGFKPVMRTTNRD